MKKAGTPADAVADAPESTTTEEVLGSSIRTFLPFVPGVGASPLRENKQRNSRLSLLFQPVVDTDVFQAIRLEASFHRVTDESEGAEAGRSELLAQACLGAKVTAPSEREGALVCLPITAGDLTKLELLDDLERALFASGMAPRRLELALSETDIITAYGKIKGPLRELHRWGVCLAVHQFAACHASLAYLEKLDVETIKLDRSLTQRLEKPLRNPHFPLAIVRGVLEVAAVLGVTVIADGIETPEQLRQLQSVGCPIQQGALFGLPKSIGQADIWTVGVPAPQSTTSIKDPHFLN